MNTLADLLNNNKNWAKNMVEQDPQFFSSMAKQQTPEYLWIGCSDSRIHANQVVSMAPGRIFVHRNIANLVQTSDINCQAVIQYAVDVLRVKHVIVCGHYGCGGVQAALDNGTEGPIDEWISNIKMTTEKHSEIISKIPKQKLADAVCELNVIEQVLTLSNNRSIRQAWEKDIDLDIHGWVYGLNNGILEDLNVSCTKSDTPSLIYERALDKLREKYI